MWTDKGTYRHLSPLSASPQQTPWPPLLGNEATPCICSESILQLLLPFTSWEQRGELNRWRKYDIDTHQLPALSSGGERFRAQSRERENCTRTRGVTWSRRVLRAEEEGWAHGARSQSPFLALPPAPSLPLDKLQGHQIFRQLLLLFGPRPPQAGSALAHGSQSPTAPCPSGRASSRLLSCDPISSSFG